MPPSAVLLPDSQRPVQSWLDDRPPPVVDDRHVPGTVAAPEVEPVTDETPRWDLLLVCVAAYIVISVGRIHQLFPALELIHPAALAGLLGIVLYLCDSKPERRAVHLNVPTTKILAALTMWMILCVPGALRISTSFSVVFDNFLKTALMYVVIASCIRAIVDVERLALVYLTGAVLYTVVVMTRFDLGSGDAWRLGHLYYYDANDFATYVVTAMPFGVYFAHASNRLIGRMFAAASLVVLTLGFVWSGSRGGFLALAAVAMFILVRYSAIQLRWRLSAAALVMFVLLATASDQYWKQMSTILSDTDYNRTQESGRLQIWTRGVGYMLDNPLFGVGPGNFQAAEGTLSELAERQQFGVGVRWNAPHNMFVQVGAEMGIPGLMLFVALLASAFVALRRSREDQSLAPDAYAAQLTPAVTASLLGFVVGSVFLSLAYAEMLYTLIALSIGLCKIAALQADERESAA
jgi:putative inorganic carbon (HCO3(-)) transporter